MRTYFLGCYAPGALKGLIGGSDREAAVKKLLESVGGKFVSLSFTRGEFDIVLVADLADLETAAGATMAIGASGAFTRMVVLNELDMAPVLETARKVAAAYTPAG